GRAGEFPRRTSQHCAGTAAVQNSTRSQVDRSGLFDPAQPDGSQRRDPQGYGRGLAVPRLVAGIDAAEVADPGPEVDLGVGVDNLLPASRLGQAELVALVRYR